MDCISHLHDEVLLRILSLLPTKDVVCTMVLSKRWKFLWKMVPILVYDDSYQKPEHEKFSLFVNRSLSLHNAPLIETLNFKLGQICGSGEIQSWIRIADNHCVRDLSIVIDRSSSKIGPVALLWSLFSGGCRMLVSLKLSKVYLVDATNFSSISFPSLKKLILKSVKYPNGEFVQRLLSNCHVLEDLDVEQCQSDNVSIFVVVVPSLKRLVLQTSSDRYCNGNEMQGYVINAPSLESLDVYQACGYCVIEDNISKIVKADIVFYKYGNHWNKLASITSAKHLFLCVPISKDVYPVGSVFRSLVHLKMCTCETGWLDLLLRVLKDSPNLLHLKIQQSHDLRFGEPRPCWIKPDTVPECLIRRLQTFEWLVYDGAEEEKEIAVFILSNAKCLKKATIVTSKSVKDSDKIREVHKSLFLSSMSSPSCKLNFR